MSLHVRLSLYLNLKMGKSKTTKFKRPHFSMGLPVNAVKEVDAEECDSDSPAADLLEKVRTQPDLVFEISACPDIFCLFGVFCSKHNRSNIEYNFDVNGYLSTLLSCSHFS